jgi:uncharacterized protein (DUF433 family)
MSTGFPAQAIPIREDDSGALRVGETRVLLELVVDAFEDGATPETIVQRYETLDLADVYAVLGYYLRHREEVTDYLRRRDEKAAEVWQRIETTRRDLSEIRRRLAARRTSPGRCDDAPGE